MINMMDKPIPKYLKKKYEDPLYWPDNLKMNIHIMVVDSNTKEQEPTKRVFSLFKKGAKIHDRTGTFEIVWVGKEGCKVRYLNRNQEWLDDHPTAPSRSKRFIPIEDYELVLNIHQNILREEA